MSSYPLFYENFAALTYNKPDQHISGGIVLFANLKIRQLDCAKGEKE